MIKTIIVKIANVIGETGLYGLFFPKCLPVFMLHRVERSSGEIPGAISAETLRSYLRYLANNRYHVLTMEDFWGIVTEGKALPAKSVMFTIDDGFYDHHDVAAQVFDEFGFVLNFFVITSFLDGTLWPWDDQVAYAVNRTNLLDVELVLPSGKTYAVDLDANTRKETIHLIRKFLKEDDQTAIYDWIKLELFPNLDVDFPSSVPEEYRPMSWNDARSLRRRGHGVFPHTCSHRILSRLSLDEKRYEIVESQTRLKKELGASPEVFAYPTGRLVDYDASDSKILEDSRFKMAFNTVTSYFRLDLESSLYSIPRFSLPHKKDDFLQIINRFEAVKAGISRA